METTLIIIILAGVLTAGLVAGLLWLLLRQRDDSGLARQNQELLGRLAQLSDDNRKSQEALSRVLTERLDKVTEKVGQTLETTSTRTAKSMGEIQERLAVIDEAQKNIQSLSSEIVSLQDILANKQARGAFGEVQLHDLVKAMLPPSAYAFQKQLGNGRRVDCLIELPNPPGPIPVDAKFPLESFHALRNAKEEADVKRARAAFVQAIKKHISDIAGRYIVAGETTDSALMFLPSEAVYAELHSAFPALVEEGYRARVWIVSPTTMMATLNTIRAVLKDVRMREQAGLIQTEVRKLFKDVVRLDKRVDNLDKHFRMAEKDIREIGVSTGKITRHAERIEELEFGEDKALAADIAPKRLGPASGEDGGGDSENEKD